MGLPSLRARARVGFIGVSALLLVGSLAVSSPALADTYSYDALGRLTRVDYTNGGYTIYNYDAAGNRTSITAQARTPTVIVVPLNGFQVIVIP